MGEIATQTAVWACKLTLSFHTLLTCCRGRCQVLIPSPMVVEILANAGMDFVVRLPIMICCNLLAAGFLAAILHAFSGGLLKRD